MNHGQRRNTLSKKDIGRLSKWAAQKPSAADEKAEITQRHRDLWDALNQYISERGGAITSVKYQSPIRLEFDPDSPLPAKLCELGYDPVYCSEETRIGAPVSVKQGWHHDRNAAYSFRSVSVYELRLPK